MIDTRLPPQPDNLKLPLYKTSRIYKNAGVGIELSSLFPLGSLFLMAQNGTTALLCHLERIGLGSRRIGLPAFFCPHFAYACLKAGHQLCFYDLDRSLSLSPNSYAFLKRENCDVIILPSFFGPSQRDEALILKILEKDGKTVILDEAQSFPFTSIGSLAHENLISLVSFGRNKPLACASGGAVVYFSKIKLPTLLSETSIVGENTSHFSDLGNLLKSMFSQNPLLEKPRFVAINSDLEASLSSHLMRIPIALERLNGFYTRLKSFLPPTFFKILSSVQGPPSILALYSEDRYYLANKLAEKGVQTTWYYYPLSLLDIYKSSPIEPLQRTLDISKHILICPWSINHSSEDLEYLTQTLIEVLSEDS